MSMSIYILILMTFAIAHVTLVVAQDDDKNYYSKRYDSIDVDLIFRSSRLLNNYVDCLLDKKPCPPEGKDLKRVLPQALRSKCSRCTKIQKSKALDVVTRLYYQHPSIYLSLAERYDPTGEYTRNFEEWFDKEYSNKLQNQIQFYEVPQKTRIPSTWITKVTTPRTYPSTTSSRPTLRTFPTTVRLNAIPTESPIFVPRTVERVTERPILSPRTTTTATTTTTSKTSTVRPPASTTILVFSLDRRLQQPISQQFDSPAIRQPPSQTQQVPQIAVQQQPVTQPISSTFSTTTTEVPTPIITNPKTSSFPFIQQISTDLLSTTGINTLPTASTSGNTPTVQTSQIPVSISQAPTVQLQVTSISSNPLPQVPLSFNSQSTVLTSNFGAAPVPNTNLNVQPQPISQVDSDFIDNFFVPRGGLIRRSVDQILDRTRGVVRAIFRAY